MIIRRKIALLAVTFLLWTLLFVLQKPLFLLFYGGLGSVVSVVWHGLPLDFSVAGYLSALPALLLLIYHLPLRSLHRPVALRVGKVVLVFSLTISALAYALSFVANIALYGYWQFPLDTTPIFFLTSSPTAAMASVSWWQALLGLLAVVAIAFGVACLFVRLFRDFRWQASGRWGGSVALLLCVAFLFLPIRGGVSVATMNTGQAYFSPDQKLNHAAVNPLLSFMESMRLQKDFAHEYRYMDDRRAHQLFTTLSRPVTHPVASEPLLRQQERPDIYLIIMESFSDTITHVPGVTPRLNAMKKDGVWFSHFYANSFRTDRGLVSNLLGVPSPATTSLMKYPKKTTAMPSLAAQLVRHGYGTHYYYGGDADFTNMRSFLVNQGFMHVTEARDFPVADRLSKWGVPDHLLFQRVEQDLRSAHDRRPMFRVIQTSSSHEPFDVPFHRFADKKLNAFAYSDDCIGRFVGWLKRSGRWSRSLVVLVPDHLGAWPDDIDNFSTWRFHVPMIWTGGVLARQGEVGVYGSQQDIAATLLGQLDIEHSMFPFSKDLLDGSVRHYAFFMMNDGFGLVDAGHAVIYDHQRQAVVTARGPQSQLFTDYGKALTQVLYDYIARLK